MNICWSRLGGMILIILICFLTTVTSQDQQWNGHYNQKPFSPPIWATSNHNGQPAATEDLQLESSSRRISTSNSFGKMPWKNPLSKPQWQAPMYKPKWQDPFSKPQWQGSKAHHLKLLTKRPFKNINVLNKQPQKEWSVPKEWQGRSRPMSYGTWNRTPVPRYPIPQPQAWPEYIPPISMIKPSMDDPHALYNF